MAFEHGDEERRLASLKKKRNIGASRTRNIEMGQNAQPGPERDRERGTLQKIDAQMPTHSRMLVKKGLYFQSLHDKLTSGEVDREGKGEGGHKKRRCMFEL